MDEEIPSRRSRLWLGYSEDNLRKFEDDQEESVNYTAASAQRDQRDQAQESSNVPNEYENLDELAAPSPVATSRRVSRRSYLQRQDVSSTSHKTDGVGDQFDNLDEVAAPPPIEDPQQEREQGYLEDRARGADLAGPQGAYGQFFNYDEFAGTGYRGQHRGNLEDGYPADTTARSPATGQSRLRKPSRSYDNEQATRLATEIYTMSHLIFFSILGTLARLGLQALTLYPGAPVQTGLLWANVSGSLILGFLSEDKKLFQDGWGEQLQKEDGGREKSNSVQRSLSAKQRHTAVKKNLPLYIGLATGFCGSFTSFSSFMRDAFFALSNALPVPIQHPSQTPISQTINVHRNPGYSFLAILAVLIVTIGLSLMALQFGAHLALFLEPNTPSIPFLFARRFIDRAVVILALGSWFAALLMAILPPDRPGGTVGNASWAQETWRSQALFALVFAPLGCLLRFYVSLYLNGKLKAFPLGTFAINILGTALEAIFIDLQRVPVGGIVGCQVLQGMADGFCGCLTTVSTWVTELMALRLKQAYLYGAVSVASGISLFVIITGSLQWTRGFAQPLCIS